MFARVPELDELEELDDELELELELEEELELDDEPLSLPGGVLPPQALSMANKNAFIAR